MIRIAKFFLLLACAFYGTSQTVPFPEVKPPVGTIGLWGHTSKGTNWDTSPYLPLYYNRNPESDVAFRLMPPNEVTYDDANGQWINSNVEEKYPVILFFHGKGESGTDNNNQLKHGGRQHRDAVLSGEFPGFLVYPQGAVPAEMRDLLYKLIDDGAPIDLTRVYVHGLSLGATRTWDFALTYPDIPAAIWPMSGIVGANDYSDLEFTPIRLTQGSRDNGPRPETSLAIAESIEDAGGNIEYILIDAGHGTWNQMYARDDFFTWFLEQQSTKIYAKFDYFEICPGDPIEVTLGVNKGYDYYEWRKDGVVIPSENLDSLAVSEFGNYSVRAVINGDTTDWSDDLTVGERQPTQTPPVTLEYLQSTVVPDPNGNTTVDLTLPDGFDSYQWYQNDVLFSTSQTISAPAGSYTALVTEKFGCSSFPSTPFVILQNSGVDVPGTPTNIQVGALSKTELEVTFEDNATNETQIELYRRIQGAQFELVQLLPPNSTSFTDTNLNPGTEYFYVLRNINENGASPVSLEVSATTDSDQNKPTVPLNFSLQTLTENSATFDWSESTDDVGISRYVIYQDGVAVVSTTETFASVFGLTKGTTYRFNVVAEDLSGNQSAFSERLIVTPTIAGLNYEYYEGTWDFLPDFNSLTPVNTGISANVDLSVREQNDNFGFRWTGKITIPVAGNYTFETLSDDGSKLYIGGFAPQFEVVDNDGLHGAEYAEGTYNFPSPGSYDIVITFFEKGGAERMEVYWKNTAHGVTSRERIPDEVFFEEITLPTENVLAPSNLTHEVLSSSSIKLDWVDEADNEINYQIFRSNADLNFVPVALLGADATTFTDQNLEPNTTYWYKIVALGLYSTSDPSLEIVSSLNLPFDNSLNDVSGNFVESSSSGFVQYDDVQRIQGSHSIHFVGSGAFVNLDQDNRFIHSSFTERSVSFWIYTETTSGIQDVFDEGGGTNGFALRINNGNLEFGVQNANVPFAIAAPISSSTWTHVTAIFDDGDIELYLDGSLAASQSNLTFSTVSAHSDAGSVGGTNGGNAFDQKNNNFNGWVDDLFVFNYALNVSQIGALIESVNSNFIVATTDEAPGAQDALQNLSVQLFDSLAIEISWDHNNGINYYQLFRSVHNDTDFRYLTLVNSNKNNYIDQRVEPHTTYNYFVRSITNSGFSDKSDTLGVTTPNNLPTFETNIPNYDLFFDEPINLLVEASDVDGDAITFSGENLESFISLNDNGDNTANLLIQPTPTDFGTYNGIKIKINDGFGGEQEVVFNVTITSNYAPEIAEGSSSYSMSGGTNLQLNFSAQDDDNDNLTWSIDGLPSFATHSSLTGNAISIDFDPSLSSDGGIYTISLQVDDDNPYNPKSDQYTFELTVIPFDPNHFIYVNLGNSGLPPAPLPYNNFTFSSASAGRTLANLSTTLGFELPVSITLETKWSGFQKGKIPGIIPDEALESGIVTTGDLETIKISGLDVTSTYNFQIMSSSKTSGDRTTTFEIDGQSASVQAYNNTSEFATINGISPDLNGDIYLDVVKPVTSVSANLNAILIEAVSTNGIPPIQPTELEYTFSGNDIQLTWLDNSYNETGFEVFRSSPDNQNYISLGVVTEPAFTDDSFPLTDLYYQVRAINTFGESGFSNEIFIEYENRAPVINGTDSVRMVPLDQEVLNLTVNDPESDAVTVEVLNEPAFVTPNIVNNAITLTFDPELGDIGHYEFFVSATDINLNNSTDTIVVDVVEALYDSVLVNTGININMNEGAPWNNFVGNPTAGSNITNLVSTLGNVTPYSVELVETWSDSDTKGEDTGNNSGVVPDNVMVNYIANSDGSVRNVLVSGLLADHTYDLTFFSSRASISESRNIKFSYDGKSTFLNARQNSTNTASLNGLKPNVGGEINIAIEGENTTWVYLNALILEFHPDTDFPIAPSNLVAQTDSTDRINLTWKDNSSNEDGFQIYNSTSSNGPWTLLETLPANTSKYTHSGLPSNNLNYYYVRAFNATSPSLNSNIVGRSTYANVIYLNLGGSGNEDPIDGIADYPWNNTANDLPEFGDITDILRNDKGEDTGIRMELIDTTPFNWGGAGYLGVVTGDDSGVFPDDVLKSYFWFESGSFVRVRFSGLQLNQIFDFEFLASRTSSNRGTRFIIGTDSLDLEATGNTTETVRFSGVIPNTFGEIDVWLTTPEGFGNGYFNAAVIRSTTNTASSARSENILESTSQNDVIADQLLVYPNPIRERLNIDFGSILSEQMILVVYDLNGRALVVNPIINAPDQYSLDLSTLETGNYILEVRSSDGARELRRIRKE